MNYTHGKTLACLTLTAGGIVLLICAWFVANDGEVLALISGICFALAWFGYFLPPLGNLRAPDQPARTLPPSLIRIPMPPVQPPKKSLPAIYDCTTKPETLCPACKFKGPYLDVPCEAHSL